MFSLGYSFYSNELWGTVWFNDGLECCFIAVSSRGTTLKSSLLRTSERNVSFPGRWLAQSTKSGAHSQKSQFVFCLHIVRFPRRGQHCWTSYSLPCFRLAPVGKKLQDFRRTRDPCGSTDTLSGRRMTCVLDHWPSNPGVCCVFLYVCECFARCWLQLL